MFWYALGTDRMTGEKGRIAEWRWLELYNDSPSWEFESWRMRGEPDRRTFESGTLISVSGKMVNRICSEPIVILWYVFDTPCIDVMVSRATRNFTNRQGKPKIYKSTTDMNMEATWCCTNSSTPCQFYPYLSLYQNKHICNNTVTKKPVGKTIDRNAKAGIENINMSYSPITS